MENVKRPRRRIVLRRFANGLGTEVIELLPGNAPMAAGQDPADAACTLSAWTEGEFCIYTVDLPENLMVRPVDWRRFAYDHAKVEALVSLCVRDNLREVLFEPWSERLRERVETTLMLALDDLRSVFETRSVRCEGGPDGTIRVTIEGEHKNAEYRSYCVSVELLG
jgi:hypothetical protein